jgi:methionyl-tRNA synthetase
LAKFFESKIPPVQLNDGDFQIIAEVNKEIAEYNSLLNACKLREALRRILAISKIGNGYFQAQQPWTLNKNDAE